MMFCVPHMPYIKIVRPRVGIKVYSTLDIRALSSAEIVGNFFSKVETYSNVFKSQRSLIMCINPQLRDSYTHEIQVVLKRTSVGHPCNPCWYPFEW